MLAAKVILAFVLGFALAQLAKGVIFAVRARGKFSAREFWEHLRRSGGMPSGHSASMVAMTTYLGCALGADPAVFAMAACVSAIIIYDAVNVRYAVGEQGKVLAELARENGIKRKLKLVEGHTWPQALAGVLLGVAIGLGLFAALG